MIVAIDGKPVRSADDVVREISERLPGQAVAVTIVRDSDRKLVRVRLGSRPTAPGSNP